jgi:hypothetical protein
MVALQYYLLRNMFKATEATGFFVMFSDECENISYENLAKYVNY